MSLSSWSVLPDRVCKNYVQSSLWEKSFAEMRRRFPALMDLCLRSKDRPMRSRRWFPSRSWVDQPHIFDISTYRMFEFPVYRVGEDFGLLLTSLLFAFQISCIPGAFHPRRWLQSSKNPHSHSDRHYLARTATDTDSVIPALTQLCVNPGCYILVTTTAATTCPGH